jgi:hypothetical protein
MKTKHEVKTMNITKTLLENNQIEYIFIRPNGHKERLVVDQAAWAWSEDMLLISQEFHFQWWYRVLQGHNLISKKDFKHYIDALKILAATPGMLECNKQLFFDQGCIDEPLENILEQLQKWVEIKKRKRK